jgi:hypothetical protein
VYATASAGVCVAGIAAALLLPPPVRGPAVYGTIAAAVGALCAFPALVRSAGKGVNGLLAGFSIGFLCRAALIAAGLVASGARDNLALVYVGAFFTLYAATQAIEVLFVHATSRPQGATR